MKLMKSWFLVVIKFDKYEAKIPRFDATRREDYRLSTYCVKAVLRGRYLIGTLAYGCDEQKSLEKTFAIIISSLKDNPLRTIQDWQTASKS